MKVYQYEYSDQQAFAQDVAALRDELAQGEHGPVLFRIFAECWCDDEVAGIRQVIRDAIPQAMLVGTASFGNICEGHYTREDIIITATVFEDPSTKVETFTCPMDPEHAQESMQAFMRAVKERPWVKAVEAFIMADVEMVTLCCDTLNELPEGIEFFGGKSRFDHSPVAPKFVIDDAGECLGSTAVFTVFGGENLHVKSGLIRGWVPLGKAMQVTRAQGDVLCELDGRPAHELYYKYLKIANDENYFFNTLEFPFLFCTHDGEPVIRISHACLPDGSMMLGASIPEHDYVCIAYGDANEILRSVARGGKEFEDFRPDAIVMYSCACRRTFWGDEKSNRETLPFQSLAPTCGYYTAGELLRRDGEITEHNSTLVFSAMREGSADAKPAAVFGMDESEFAGDEGTNFRLSTFVAAAIDELEEANRELERMAITDGLTGLLNRRETERRIREALDADGAQRGDMHLLMMDLDDFKQINDEFGHQEGDLVLQAFSALLQECTGELGEDMLVGRWGGEEFIALVFGVDDERAVALGEQVCRAFAGKEFEVSGTHSVSVGVTAVSEHEDADAAMTRADAAMYEAKHHGKNQVAVL